MHHDGTICELLQLQAEELEGGVLAQELLLTEVPNGLKVEFELRSHVTGWGYDEEVINVDYHQP